MDGASTTSDMASREPGEAHELRGSVLDVLRVLLANFEGRDQILAIVGRLITRNAELEQQLAKTLFKKSEQVSTAQLLLALGALGLTGGGASSSADDARAQPEALDDADSKLRHASGIDGPKPEDTKTPRPPRQPRTRTPAPAHLERVPNKIPVPVAERACPTCGAERTCIGHEPTEVIDLIPAKVFVRVDLREKLVCRPCEGEHVRAPLPDKVVPGGKPRGREPPPGDPSGDPGGGQRRERPGPPRASHAGRAWQPGGSEAGRRPRKSSDFSYLDCSGGGFRKPKTRHAVSRESSQSAMLRHAT